MKTKTFTNLSLLLSSLLFASACGHDNGDHSHDGDHSHNGDHSHEDGDAAHESSDAEGKAEEKLADASLEAQRRDYPIETCLVSGEKLGDMGEIIEHVVEERLIRLCCKACVKDVTKDPTAFVARLDVALEDKVQRGDGHETKGDG